MGRSFGSQAFSRGSDLFCKMTLPCVDASCFLPGVRLTLKKLVHSSKAVVEGALTWPRLSGKATSRLA